MIPGYDLTLAKIFVLAMLTAALSPSPSTTGPLTLTLGSDFCDLAQVMPSGAVIVDWRCVEAQANAFGPGMPYTREASVVTAFVMKAIRDRKAKDKP